MLKTATKQKQDKREYAGGWLIACFVPAGLCLLQTARLLYLTIPPIHSSAFFDFQHLA